MNTFKLEAMVKEFPFLKETALKSTYDGPRSSKECDGIEIKRVTADLLGKFPTVYTWVGSLVGINEWDRVDFVLRDGKIITDAVKANETHGSNYAHEETHTSEGETVLEAIHRHGISEKLWFIVWTQGGYNVVEYYSRPNWCATVYKPAKDFTLTQAIEQAQVRAAQEVAAESNF